MPELLTEVGHQGMQHQLQLLHHLSQHLTGGALVSQSLRAGILPWIQAPLAELQVPVTNLIPCELIEPFGGFPQGVAAIALGAVAIHPGQTRQDPTVRQLQGSRIWGAEAGGGFTAEVHQRKAGGVPELVGEIAGGFHRGGGLAPAVVIQPNVLTGSGHLTHQGKAQGIGAITINQQQWIDAIAG